MAAQIFLIVFTVVAYAFFSGMELAYASSNKLRLELEAPDGRFESRSLTYIYSRQGLFLSMLWLLSSLSFIVYLLSAFVFLSSQFPHIDTWLLMSMGGVASLLLLTFVSDAALRLVFRFNPTTVFRVFSLPLSVLTYLLKPIMAAFYKLLKSVGLKDSGVFHFSINRICRDKEYSDLCRSEMSEQGDDTDEEVRMFQNALDFSNVRIKDCIVPRTEIAAIDVESSLDDLKSMFVDLNYSRILVYKDNIDNILGYVHSLDMFDNPHEIKDMLNPLPVVRENMPANRMLRIFLQQHKGMALVVDEFGGTAGIVTLEDIMEEIFGEIEDEHDEDEAYVSKKMGKNEYLLSGRLEIDAVNESYGLHLPVSEEYTTIAGLLLHENYILPDKGDEVLVGRYDFSIMKVSYTRIELVRLKVRE
ncbi:MAG: hemolysin family protein [Paludibacteraceae bacterium]|nr:HlyC/CorC family transporter [Prevotellaceae bacterium]